jgi:hypothetical protein
LVHPGDPHEDREGEVYYCGISSTFVVKQVFNCTIPQKFFDQRRQTQKTCQRQDRQVDVWSGGRSSNATHPLQVDQQRNPGERPRNPLHRERGRHHFCRRRTRYGLYNFFKSCFDIFCWFNYLTSIKFLQTKGASLILKMKSWTSY